VDTGIEMLVMASVEYSHLVRQTCVGPQLVMIASILCKVRASYFLDKSLEC